jgi:hypothetical protein
LYYRGCGESNCVPRGCVMRTITAKYRGTCKGCQGPIRPGDTIRFGGTGKTYHPECDGVSAPASAQFDAPVFRTCAQGGRCEDFPCCGCHGLHGRELYMPSEPPEWDDREW